MEALDHASIEQEIAEARKAAQERMDAQARVLQAERDLAEAERKMEKLNRRSDRATRRIERMRANVRFIENGWVDDEAAVNEHMDGKAEDKPAEGNGPKGANEK